MKTVIAGSRGITDTDVLVDAIEESGIEITEVVSGGARGVDTLGEWFAEAADIPIKQFIPDWSIGKRAGMIRNERMAAYADAAIILWDGKSRGTKNMIQLAKEYDLELFVKIIS